MRVKRTIVIAAPEHHGGLLEQRELEGAQALDSSEAFHALDVIKEHKPDLIAIERAFASTPRGIALINRIKTDVALAGCLIRCVDTRRAPRVHLSRSVQVLIDGGPVRLVDVSRIGAQVVSTTTLRPNQRVRMSLPDTDGVRFDATIAWSAFEIPADGPRYRAGVEFHGADETLIGFMRTVTAA